jgi:hypothetical protein
VSSTTTSTRVEQNTRLSDRAKRDLSKRVASVDSLAAAVEHMGGDFQHPDLLILRDWNDKVMTIPSRVA